MRRTRGVLVGLVIVTLSISACSGTTKSNSGDAVLSRAAERACEDAVTSANNLADFSQWQHHLSGDLNPSYTDSGTVHMELAGQINGTKHFSCSGRVDPQTGIANAVVNGGLTG
jgi:hypothetical protein